MISCQMGLEGIQTNEINGKRVDLSFRESGSWIHQGPRELAKLRMNLRIQSLAPDTKVDGGTLSHLFRK